MADMRWIFATALYLSSAFPASAQDFYRVQFGGRLERVSVQACFERAAPTHLRHHAEAYRYVESFTSGDQKLRIATRAETTRLSVQARGECLHWTVNLERAVRQGDFRLAMRSGVAVLTDVSLWFWRSPGNRDVQVEVRLPEGMKLSTPWAPAGKRGDALLFLPDKSPAAWTARVAVGHFPQLALEVPGTQIRLAIAGTVMEEERANLEAWVRLAASSVASVYGRYPVATPQVLVVPIGRRHEPVPWAHVMRGGGRAVEFFVDETRSLGELQGDWTVYHELSHMLLPFIASEDRWLSEGLASYYQYVLMARSGMLTPNQAWQELHDGFNRGRRNAGEETLAAATRQGRSHTMQIYWSGAAMMMLADTRLRAQSGGRQSLDTALASLPECCLGNQRRWRAQEVFRELDRATGGTVFKNLLDAHEGSSEFPDLSESWRKLGVDDSDQELVFSDKGEWLWIREAIMGEGQMGSE
jgi:predicted metalloprotease with PDZ domain